MAIARAHLIDPAVTRWYHCITGCVRRAFLLGEGADDRKLWIDKRIEELAQIFSIAVAGFSVLDNHLHLLVWSGLIPTSQRAGPTKKSSAAGEGCFHPGTSRDGRSRSPTTGFSGGSRTPPGWPRLAHACKA